MEWCKLQICCMVIVVYLMIIYFRAKKSFHIKKDEQLYEVFLLAGFVCLFFDGLTAYTVNHEAMISHNWNLVFHAFFLISIDFMIFMMFVYFHRMTESKRPNRKRKLLLCSPFVVNVIVVLWNIPTLEFRVGEHSKYSMGVSAYTCFVMAFIYILLTFIIIFRHWNNIQRRKRVSIVTCLCALVAVIAYQSIFPDALVTSIATMMTVLGLYINIEDPAMQELSRYHEEMIVGFATLVDSRDQSTGNHVNRTTHYVKLLVNALRERGYYRELLTKDYVNNLLLAAPMHDIGKIAVSDSILQKPGRLTKEEFENMKEHPVKGGEIIKNTFSRIGNEQYLNMAYEIVRFHHEKWDGSGYPDHLKENEIPLDARIMAIADVFDAISADRCYRKSMPMDVCFQIIEEGKGKDFDPILVDVFLQERENIIKLCDELKQ